MKIKNIILNILASIFIITLFLFALTWIIFDFQGSSNSLKDTWSIVSSLFGGIATLAAAYIALIIFNGWKFQHNMSVSQRYINELLMRLRIITDIQKKQAACVHKFYTENKNVLGDDWESLNYNHDEILKLKQYVSEYKQWHYEYSLFDKDKNLLQLTYFFTTYISQVFTIYHYINNIINEKEISVEQTILDLYEILDDSFSMGSSEGINFTGKNYRLIDSSVEITENLYIYLLENKVLLK